MYSYIDLVGIKEHENLSSLSSGIPQLKSRVADGMSPLQLAGL
jgi:hypothetical protein